MAKISLIQGFTEKEIVDSLMSLLNQIDKNRVDSDFYKERSKDQYKRVKNIVKQAVKDPNGRNETLVKSAESFKRRGIFFVGGETGKNSTKDYTPKGTIVNVGAYLNTQFSDSFNELINSKIKPLLPKKQKDRSNELIIHLGIFAKNQAVKDLPISNSLFYKYLKDNFGWTPRTNKDLIILIRTVTEIKAIKISEIVGTTPRQTFFFDIGANLAEELEIPETTTKIASRAPRTDSRALELIVDTFDYID